MLRDAFERREVNNQDTDASVRIGHLTQKHANLLEPVGSNLGDICRAVDYCIATIESFEDFLLAMRNIEERLKKPFRVPLAACLELSSGENGANRAVSVRGIVEIERCHQELVRYIESQPPDPISFEHVALSHEFLPHIERACQILDEQEIPHPEVNSGVVFDGTGKWGKFLARVLAVKHDVNKARLVYGEVQCCTDREERVS